MRTGSLFANHLRHTAFVRASQFDINAYCQPVRKPTNICGGRCSGTTFFNVGSASSAILKLATPHAICHSVSEQHVGIPCEILLRPPRSHDAFGVDEASTETTPCQGGYRRGEPLLNSPCYLIPAGPKRKKGYATLCDTGCGSTGRDEVMFSASSLLRIAFGDVVVDTSAGSVYDDDGVQTHPQRRDASSVRLFQNKDKWEQQGRT